MLRVRRTAFLFTAALLLAAPARAQDAPPPNPLCETPRETIVTPYDHHFGVPVVWDATYHPVNSVIQFAAGLPVESGGVLSWGRKLAPDTLAVGETLLVELNYRGRAQVLKNFAARADENPAALIRLGKNYVAASQVGGAKDKGRRRARLSWYGADLSYKAEKILQDDVFDYRPRALVPAVGGTGFIALLHAVNHRNAADNNAVLLRYNADGALLWRRSYRPGAANEIDGLRALPDGTYLATGTIALEDGRPAGWVMKLAADGAIMWQRSYPRGKAARLRQGAPMPHTVPGYNILLVAGTVEGTDGGTIAAWLMALNSTGEVLWQRYIRRPEFNFTPFGIAVEEDGRITLAVNAEALEVEAVRTDHRSHIRLFTLASNGVVIADEPYVNGLSAQGAQLQRGAAGERIVIGTIRSDARPPTPSEQLAARLKGNEAVPETTPENAPENTESPPVAAEIEQAGWVFVATALEPYDDPCLVKPASSKARKE